MKAIRFLFSFLIAILAGTAIATASALPVLPIIGGLAIVSFIPTGAGSGVAMVGVYREVWTGEMVKRFTHTGKFLEAVPDYSRFADNDVIHLVDIGAHPDVLINNTTYPLTPQSLGENDISISLAKFETVPTAITDDELNAISYPKMEAAVTLHREALEMSTSDKAAHALAPTSDTANTPIVKTTGGNNGSGFKRMTMSDIKTLKRKYDDMKAPKEGRVLVLSNQHIEDLLVVSEVFQNQYQNISEGQILRLYGFDIYEYVSNPVYNATFVKKAYGAVSAVTDRESSFSFIKNMTFKARGSVVPYLTPAEALNKRNIISYNLYHVALPKKLYGIAAIVNDSI